MRKKWVGAFWANHKWSYEQSHTTLLFALIGSDDTQSAEDDFIILPYQTLTPYWYILLLIAIFELARTN